MDEWWFAVLAVGRADIGKAAFVVWYDVQGPPMIFENSVASRVS